MDRLWGAQQWAALKWWWSMRHLRSITRDLSKTLCLMVLKKLTTISLVILVIVATSLCLRCSLSHLSSLMLNKCLIIGDLVWCNSSSNNSSNNSLCSSLCNSNLCSNLCSNPTTALYHSNDSKNLEICLARHHPLSQVWIKMLLSPTQIGAQVQLRKCL